MLKTWVWRMAWRDARRGLKPLLLATICVILGVASVVTAYSFRDNLNASVRSQSKTLLGADLSIESREPLAADDEALIASIQGEQSRQISFASMVYFPASGASRLVQVRAIKGGFPYYGTLETEPASAARDFRTGANALVDENVMVQLRAQPGDRLRIGEQEFRIAGKLKKIPGETVAFSLISPRVYVPLEHLEETELLQKGSIVRYRVYYKLPPQVDADALVQNIWARLESLRLRADTVSRRMAGVAASMENLSRYLRLAVFVAVLLSGVGIASGVHVYVKGKTAAVAVLRCVGAKPRDTVFIYLLQTFMLAFGGALTGALAGAALQTVLPLAFKDFLPVNATASVAPAGIAAGMAVGLGTTLLFALIPLLPLRNISPLLALRASYETNRRRDPLSWVLYGVIAVAVTGFAVSTTASWISGLWFTAGVALAFGLLVVIAKGLAALLRKLVPGYLPFAWRQGLASLHRPNNQTAAIVLAVGLATFLLVTLYNVRHQLVQQVAERGGAGEANLVLFDVQQDQRQELRQLLSSMDIALQEQVPVVTMRLTSVKGRQVEELRADSAARIPRWALRREYRSTYRADLAVTEKLIKGRWHAKVNGDAEPIPISLEHGIAETLRVDIGDSLEFEVQGVSLRTQVANLREVDWQRVRPNFFVVFPEGVLEAAPQFYVIAARAEDAQQTAALQRSVAERYGNVSVIDITLILNTVNAVLGRVSYAIRFVAGFTILTGFAVLTAAILSSRGQRIKESILLRTLGAPRSQILTGVVAEYVFAGAVAALAGTALALAASWGLSLYFFKTIPQVTGVPLLVIPLVVTVVTVGAGVLGCWGLFRRPALDALRAEA
ncbi:MAG TPA: FtsX-like permease family protein [Candidatus Binatia bacterium]|nr:FtsX-like permease family protein [Candidatus Binatia bacterium]